MTNSLVSSAIEVSALSYAYGTKDTQKQVLFDINVQVKAGELVILTGPSGSGKTTLLTLIGALRRVQQGSIRLYGEDISALSPQEVRQSIGFIFQDHNMFDALTALQTLLLTTKLRPRTQPSHDLKAESEQLLSSLGLEAHLHDKPGRLSRGQAQRVAIARALINRPRLILADEPTAALDVGWGTIVMDLLRQRVDHDQSTVIMVSHDRRIFSSADRVLTMIDGRLDNELVP